MSTSSGPSSSSPAGGGGGGGGGGPCGACKFLRRKCVGGCIFAPYFDSEQGAAQFGAVHKVFGASNVSKLLHHVPVHKRLDAVVTISYEAQARLRDPVYGCVAHIFALQQQVVNLQAELSYLHSHLATLELPTPPPAPPQPPPLLTLPSLSIADLPTFSTAPATYDLSTLFDPIEHPSWSLQYHRDQDFPTSATPPPEAPSSAASHGGGDLGEVACELLNRHPCRNVASNLPPHST